MSQGQKNTYGPNGFSNQGVSQATGSQAAGSYGFGTQAVGLQAQGDAYSFRFGKGAAVTYGGSQPGATNGTQPSIAGGTQPGATYVASAQPNWSPQGNFGGAAQPAYGMAQAGNTNAAYVGSVQNGNATYAGSATAANPASQGAMYADPNMVQAQQFSHMNQSQAQQPQQKPPKKKRGIGFWIAIIIAILAIAAAAFFAFQNLGPQSGLRDPNQASGQLEGKTPEEIQAELDRIVDEGMFNISIASYVEFATGTSPGEIRIENVPGNIYLMKVIITDDSGRQLYESGIVEPNHHVQSTTLDVDLDAGTYDCTATFVALDPDTEEEVGQAAARITINVLS